MRPAARTSSRAVALTLTLGAVVTCAALAWGLVPKLRRRALLEREAAAAGQTERTEYVLPTERTSLAPVVLPGSVRPLEETTIYPRVTGYVDKWNVDLGDAVKENDVLAEISTPDLDQEIAVANAAVMQALAGKGQTSVSAEHSKRDAERYASLNQEGVASAIELDEKQAQAKLDAASVGVADATILSKQKEVARLEQLKSFAVIRAPFAGIITARSIERGALVTPGTSTALFTLQATDPVRVLVAVPQDLAPSVTKNLKATVTLREFPTEAFDGSVARTSHALDPLTRTMTTEVRVPNASGRILTGMAAKVALTVPATHRVFEIPGTAVITGAQGLRVAVIDGEDKIRLQPIEIERDLGATVLVSRGLEGGERVVKNATAALREGATVTAVEAKLPSASPSGR
ncbi:MAG: efflux RND transporter periplasmic adaptor subunit [Polyangiaceae bacterium]